MAALAVSLFFEGRQRNKITQVLLRWCGDGGSSGRVWLLRDYPEGLRPFRVILRPGRLSRHTDFLRQRVDKLRIVHRAMQRRQPETAAAQPVSGGAGSAVTRGAVHTGPRGAAPKAWGPQPLAQPVALPEPPAGVAGAGRAQGGAYGARGTKKEAPHPPRWSASNWPWTPKGWSAHASGTARREECTTEARRCQALRRRKRSGRVKAARAPHRRRRCERSAPKGQP